MPDAFGHVEKLDLGLFAKGGEEGVCEVDPGAGRAGADVVEAGGRLTFGEVEGHLHGILHIHEVAHLAAVRVFGFVAFEKPDASCVLDFIERLANEAAHVALVIFIWTENIEVFDANDVIEDPLAHRVEVEEVLRVAVEIQRTKTREVGGFVVHPSRAVAVGRGGGGIDEPRA